MHRTVAATAAQGNQRVVSVNAVRAYERKHVDEDRG